MAANLISYCAESLPPGRNQEQLMESPQKELPQIGTLPITPEIEVNRISCSVN